MTDYYKDWEPDPQEEERKEKEFLLMKEHISKYLKICYKIQDENVIIALTDILSEPIPNFVDRAMNWSKNNA